MYEGFGFIAAEALSCNKPLIYSNFPAINEIAKDHGISVPSNNPEALSKEILNIINNPTKIKSREFIIKNFNWERTYKKHLEAYEKVIKT